MHNSECMSRRDFMATSMLWPAVKALQGRPKQKMNFILFMPDQLRAESIACYGHPLVQTPNMDRLAAEGVRFDHCQAAYPVCTASRCNLLTGWYPHVAGHRTVYNLLKPHEPNLFKYLVQNGYNVFWYGKNDVLVHDRFHESATEWADFADGPEWGGKGNPWPGNDPRYYSFLYGAGGDRTSFPDYSRVQAAITKLQQPNDKPFCIFLPLFFPHPPFTASADFYHMYRPEDLPPLRPARFEKKPEFYNAIHTMRRLDKVGESFLRQIQAVYLGMISYTDWLLGRLLEAVDASGHRDDTVVIVCSDHGEWAGDYGLVEKWSTAMDDVLLRVPLIIRMPGGVSAHVVHTMVELHDLMATLLELAGIEPGHTHFAQSLVPHLSGAQGNPRHAVFSEGGYNRNEPHCFEPLEKFTPDHIYYPKIELEVKHPDSITRTTMIRTSDYKLTWRPEGMSEFYDLRKDPQELNNVIQENRYNVIISKLQSDLLDWYVRVSDAVPFGRDDRNLPPAQGGKRKG